MYTIKSIQQYLSIRVSYKVASLLVGTKMAHLLCGADSSDCLLSDIIDTFAFSPNRLDLGPFINSSDYEKEKR